MARSALLTISLLAGACVLYALVLGPIQEARSQRLLWAQLREEFALQTSPIGGDITPGAPIGRLDIEAIGVHDVVFVEGTTAGQLQTGPGHRRDTALPGQAGVAVLMGRGSLFGAPFGRISELEPGDTIAVTSGRLTGQGTSTYKVDRVRRDGDPLPAAPEKGAGRLTLVSSERTSWGGSWARSTVFVDATLQDPPQPSMPGRPTSVSAAEAPMRGDQTALVPLVFWLAALALALAALGWARARWGQAQALLVGVPVIIALLWGTASVATRLLPNLV